MNDSLILETRALSIGVSNRILCRDLSVQLSAGQCLGVLGQNGTGKTTLLHTLINFRSAEQGEVLLCGKPVTEWPRKELAKLLGILFQSNSDDMPASVLETAILGRHPHLSAWQWESSDDLEEARAALQAAQLDTMEERDITTLSGGERQRLAIAMLLTQNPRLYLLDEPGNHLDVAFQIKSLQLLRDRILTSGAGLCMATHDINLAARFCDQILLLTGNGNFVLGTTQEVLQPEILSAAYDCEIRQAFHEDGSVFFPA